MLATGNEGIGRQPLVRKGTGRILTVLWEFLILSSTVGWICILQWNQSGWPGDMKAKRRRAGWLGGGEVWRGSQQEQSSSLACLKSLGDFHTANPKGENKQHLPGFCRDQKVPLCFPPKLGCRGPEQPGVWSSSLLQCPAHPLRSTAELGRLGRPILVSSKLPCHACQEPSC